MTISYRFKITQIAAAKAWSQSGTISAKLI